MPLAPPDPLLLAADLLDPPPRELVPAAYVPHAPHPPQRSFLELDCMEALYGGAAGGGKSDALLMAALRYVDVPGYAALILRKTYTDLALPGAIMDRAKTWLAGTDARWNDTEKRFTFPTGASLTFGYLQSENDKYRYQSAEFQFVAFDELTQFEKADYLYLFSRCRKPSEGPLADVPLRVRGASNPGGRGHRWTRSRFILREPDPEDPEDTPEAAAERVFIPAKLDDNPSVDRGSYMRQLAALDPQTRAQLLDGDWNARPPGDWVFPEGLDSVFALGARLAAELASGRIAPPVGPEILLTADWGVNAHILLLWPLEGGGFFVPYEVVYHGDSVWEAAPKVAALTRHLGYPVREERFDASMPGLNAAFLRELRPLMPGRLKHLAIPFGKFKEVGVDYLRLLVARTHAHMQNPDSTPPAPLLAVSEEGAPVLAEQMRGMQYQDADAGKVAKGDDHGFDALVAGVAPDAARRRKAQTGGASS